MERSIDINAEWKTLGLVLDQFNALERKVAKLIRSYIQPSEARSSFVEETLLHNTCVPFGSKVKLLLCICRDLGGPQLNRESFHRILNIRNALAHGHTLDGLRVNANALRPEPYGAYLVIETVKGDGSTKQELRATAIADFFRLHGEIEAECARLEKALEESR
jgi:hypothetical protein